MVEYGNFHIFVPECPLDHYGNFYILLLEQADIEISIIWEIELLNYGNFHNVVLLCYVEYGSFYSRMELIVYDQIAHFGGLKGNHRISLFKIEAVYCTCIF